MAFKRPTVKLIHGQALSIITMYNSRSTIARASISTTDLRDYETPLFC